jgi:hypothetical protein
MSSLRGRRRRALIGVIGVIADDESGDIILLGPLRLPAACLAYLGDLHAVIRCWFHFFLHIGSRAAIPVPEYTILTV